MALDSLRRLFLRSPLGSLATWLVIGVAMALPGALYLALDNLDRLASRWDGAAQISLFLKLDVTDDSGSQLAQKLEREAGVAKVQFISRQQALDEFRELSGFGDVLNQLERNPLPAVIVVQPLEATLGGGAEKLLAKLKALPEVEQAVLDLQWVQRLTAIMALGQKLALALRLMLAVGVVLVVGNTIRLAIESRRDEILVMKLVGATNRFVRRPFLYTGGWYGLGPVAVAPERQGAGIGAALINAGLDELRARGAAGCVLLGDPAYYERFGFRSGGLRYGAADPRYVMGLAFGAEQPTGEIGYHEAFGADGA